MIKDKVVIITGASSGIGAATAKLLASQGAKVILGARREEKLAQLVEQIQSTGGQAIYQVMDVTKLSDNEKIVELAKERFGKVDVIFLNAGIMPSAPLSALQTDKWDQTVDVNVKGVMYGVAAVLPTFISQKSGHVIVTSSVAGLKAYMRHATYCGTKWFVRSFMEVLRMESIEEGTNIRTALINPGAVNTELLSTISHEDSAEAMAQLFERVSIPSDRIASAVAFAIEQPEDTNVTEITVGPTIQAW